MIISTFVSFFCSTSRGGKRLYNDQLILSILFSDDTLHRTSICSVLNKYMLTLSGFIRSNSTLEPRIEQQTFTNSSRLGHVISVPWHMDPLQALLTGPWQDAKPVILPPELYTLHGTGRGVRHGGAGGGLQPPPTPPPPPPPPPPTPNHCSSVAQIDSSGQALLKLLQIIFPRF